MKKLLTLFACVLISSCASDAPAPVKQLLEFAPRTNLNVLTVTVLDRSFPQTIDSRMSFQPSIAAAVRQALTQRLIAVGSTGEAVVIIKDATLKGESLPHDDHDWWDRPQASKYTGHVEISLQINNREGQGLVTAQASHYVTLPENPTIEERQNAYNTVLNNLMHDLGSNLSSGIQTHLGTFVVVAPMMDQSPR